MFQQYPLDYKINLVKLLIESQNIILIITIKTLQSIIINEIKKRIHELAKQNVLVSYLFTKFTILESR